MTKKLTQDEFEERVIKILGDEFEVRGLYTDINSEFNVYHKLCKGIWCTTLKKLRSNSNSQNCKVCNHKKKGKKHATPTTKYNYKSKVKDKTNGLIEVIGEYTGHDDPIEVRCTKHNRMFPTRITYIMRGTTVCRDCNAEYLREVQRKESSIVDEHLLIRHEGAIIRIGEYVNTHTPIEFLCKVCTSVFTAEPNSVTRISGCPTCAYSKGESEIASFMKRNSIAFTTQKRFEGCFYKRQLMFDFYLDELNILIEYNGLQHYKPIEFFGGEEAFQNQLKRDKIKREFAKNNNIPLFVIPYITVKDKLVSELEAIVQYGSCIKKQGSNAKILKPKIKNII